MQDVIWSLAYTIGILAIWEGKINLIVLMLIFLIGPIFEVLQHLDIISGTPDLIDVLSYTIFSLLGIILKKLKPPQPA